MKRNWYKVRVKYGKDMDGMKKKVNEEYLVDALSFTETEKRMAHAASALLDTREFDITAIAVESITDILGDDDDAAGKWYKAIVSLMIEDESGKSKASPQTLYVNASDTKEADSRVRESMKASPVDWEIKSITESKVHGVLNYAS